MTTQTAFINFSLILVLLLTLAFKCGNNSSDENPGNEPHTNTGALTEATVKQFITGREERAATGAGGSPDSVTVTFESINFGTTRTATVQDQYDGVPKGETVYPMRVKYTPHRRWINGTKEDPEIYYSYDFYLNKYGEWDALSKGPVR